MRRKRNHSSIIGIRATAPLRQAVVAKCKRLKVPMSSALRSLLVRWTAE